MTLIVYKFKGITVINRKKKLPKFTLPLISKKRTWEDRLGQK